MLTYPTEHLDCCFCLMLEKLSMHHTQRQIMQINAVMLSHYTIVSFFSETIFSAVDHEGDVCIVNYNRLQVSVDLSNRADGCS